MNLRQKLELQDQLRRVEGQRVGLEASVPHGFLYSPAGEFFWISDEPHGFALADLEGTYTEDPDGYFISDTGKFKNWGRGTLTIKERNYPKAQLFVAVEPYANMVHVAYADDLRTIGYDDFEIDRIADESDYLAQMGAAQAKRYLDDAGIPNQIIVDDFMPGKNTLSKTKTARYGLQGFATAVICRPFEQDETGKWIESNTWQAFVAPDDSEDWAHVDVIYMQVVPKSAPPGTISVGMLRSEAYKNLRRHLYSPVSQGLILFSGPLEVSADNAETFQAALEFAAQVYEDSGFPVAHYGLLAEDLAQAQGAHWGFEGPPPVLWDEVTPEKLEEYAKVAFNLLTIDEDDYAVEPTRRTDEVNTDLAPHADQSWWEKALGPQNGLDIIRNQNRPFKPLGKTAHWIPGYIAIILDERGQALLGKSESTYHPEISRNGQIMDRGLYNPETKHLLIMGNNPDRYLRGEEFYFNDIMPIGYPATDTKKKWRKAVQKAGIPVNRIDWLWAQKETNPFRAIDGMGPTDYVVTDDAFQQQLQLPTRGAKTSHWVPGYVAAIITGDGKLQIADDFGASHSDLPDFWSINSNYRGIYNPKTHHLIHMSTPDDWKRERHGDVPAIGYEHSDVTKDWLKAAAKSNIPVSGVDYIYTQPETNIFNIDIYDEDSALRSNDYVLQRDPAQKQLQMALQSKTSHWIEGFHAAILNRNNDVAIAQTEEDFHGARALWEELGVNSFNDIGRGLYNPQTKVLYVIRDIGEGVPEMDGWPTPSDEEIQASKERWLEGFRKAGIEVIWGGRLGRITNEDAERIPVSEPASDDSYELQAYAKTSHWLNGFNAANLFSNVRRLRDVLNK